MDPMWPRTQKCPEEVRPEEVRPERWCGFGSCPTPVEASKFLPPKNLRPGVRDTGLWGGAWAGPGQVLRDST